MALNGWAEPRTLLPVTAFDGGAFSSESLGRGQTTASTRGTPASGSENPAALIGLRNSSLYATSLVNTKSDLSKTLTRSNDPTGEKVLQYLSIGAERGVIFFEPMGRLNQRQIVDSANPTTHFNDVEFAANAIGFAGATKFKKNGSIGMSLAYLRGSYGAHRAQPGVTNQTDTDTADGIRLNLGMRYATGPSMWGLFLKNAPGFLWWKDHKRDLLPFSIKVGNTYKLRKGALLSVEGEKRFYAEGSQEETFIYIGQEYFASQHVAIRGGVYGDEIGRVEGRRWTAGLTIITGAHAEISYAFEHFELNQESVNRSYVSMKIPMASMTK